MRSLICISSTVVILWLYLFYNRHGAHLSTLVHSNIFHEDPKQLWVQTSMNTFIDGPPNLDPIRALCNRTQWRDDLIINCPNLWGGVGNVRNKVLTCLRYAIEAGGMVKDMPRIDPLLTVYSASSFIVPSLIRRDKSDLSHLLTGSMTGLEYMFNREHFVSSIQQACPKMHLYRDERELQLQGLVWKQKLEVVH